MLELLSDIEFWVAVAFVILVGATLYYKVPARVGAILDERADLIRQELEDARKLREEAQKLLASHEAKRKQAERDVQEILDVAKQEAEALAAEMRRDFEAMIERRRAAAEDAIKRAEIEAVQDIRTHAAELSVATAEEVLRKHIKGAKATKLIDDSVKTISERLH